MNEEQKLKSKKIFDFFDEIFDSNLNRMILEIKTVDLIEEIPIFFESSFNSLNLSRTLLEDNDFINSMCILRSAFESLICGCAMNVDKLTYDHFKYKDIKCYEKKLNETRRKNGQGPIEVKAKDFMMSPFKLRETVVDNRYIIFGDVFEDEKKKKVEKDFKEYYDYLCSFVHPSFIKIYSHNVQAESNTTLIKSLLRANILYCQFLLSCACSQLLSENRIDDISLMYGFITIFNLGLIDKNKKEQESLDKYRRFLYIDINKEIYNKQKKKAEILRKEWKEFEGLKFNEPVLKELLMSLAEYLGIEF